MLGGGSNGSYALSKSKSDLFLRALESYIHTIVDILNKQLIEPLWRLNGLDFALMPKIKAGDVASHDLKEMGAYLRNLNGANITVADDLDIVNALMEIAELPKPNPEIYAEAREREYETQMARNQYYDDDNIKGTTLSPDDSEDEDDKKVGS
jgi:phage gp29-like protein